MSRTMLVSIAAALATALTAGGAFAGVTSAARDTGPPAHARAHDQPLGADLDELLAPAAQDGGGDLDDDAALATEDAETDDSEANDDAFGQLRSQEVSQFGECMDATDGDRETCDEFHPRPATEHPGHPVFGDDGRRAGQQPGPPEHAGPPEGAGPPDHAGGPAKS